MPSEPLRAGRARRVVAALVAVTALVLLPALPAAAHDALVSATPAAGSTVTSATAVALVYDEPVLDLAKGRNGITVTDSAGRHYETACALVDAKAVSVPIALGTAGTYTVAWRVVSDDGHPVSGDYTFTYAPKSGAAAARGTTSGPSCGGTGESIADEAKGISLASLAAIVASAFVLLAVIAVVIAIAVRSRRRV